MGTSFESIDEVLFAARRNLSADAWDFTVGGAETEATIRRNRQALDRIAFRPRILIDVSGRTTETEFLGQRISMPVMLSPIGSIAMFDHDGAAAAARAAAEAGTMVFASVMADPSIEDVAAASTAPKVVQVTPMGGDREWMKDTIARAQACGYIGVCVTVDSTGSGTHYRNKRNRFHPHHLHRHSNFGGVEQHPDASYRERIGWDDIEWLGKNSELPLILKGVGTAEDARQAVERGVAVVYASNHGGLRLDFAQAGIEILAEVVDAVGGIVPVVVDGGFLRGADVVKAIAMGASAVLVGRLQCFGLAAGGAKVLAQTLRMLQEEISSTMALLGANTVGDLTPSSIRDGGWTLSSEAAYAPDRAGTA